MPGTKKGQVYNPPDPSSARLASSPRVMGHRKRHIIHSIHMYFNYTMTNEFYQQKTEQQRLPQEPQTRPAQLHRKNEHTLPTRLHLPPRSHRSNLPLWCSLKTLLLHESRRGNPAMHHLPTTLH